MSKSQKSEADIFEKFGPAYWSYLGKVKMELKKDKKKKDDKNATYA